MESGELKKKTLTGFLWRFAERCGAQGVQFIVSIVLARILSPDDYGTLALIAVFTNILAVFINSGMGVALIQKKDADDLDYSTLFYFNVVMCLSLYFIMFFSAPAIAKFYKIPELTAYTRVVSLTLLASGVRGIQSAYVAKHMLFKRFFFSTLGGTIISAVVGIAMAYMGYGVWALIAQEITNVTIDTIILWVTVKWRPKKMFSFKRLKALFSYGWKMLAASLVNTFYSQLRQLIIGKLYSPSDLAYYNKGDTFPAVISNNINTSIDSVLLPSMASVQDDRVAVKQMTRRAIMTSTYCMAPLLIGLAATGKSVISLLLTDKWLPCLPFMMLFCISGIFVSIHTANLNAIKAVGRSDLFLKLEVIKKIVGITNILLTMRISVMAMAWGGLIVNVLSQVINSWPNRKLLGYSYLEQMKDIMPNIIIASVMGVITWSINLLNLNSIITLLLQVPLGVIIYFVLSKCFKIESYEYILSIIKPKLKSILKK